MSPGRARRGPVGLQSAYGPSLSSTFSGLRPRAFPILRAVSDRHDDGFLTVFVDLLDNDIWPFEKLARAFNKTGAPHIGQFGAFQPHDLVLDARDHVQRGSRIVPGDPGKDAIKFVAGGGLERNLHAQDERKRWKTPSAGTVCGLGLAGRRRTSAACSSVSRSALLSCSSISSTICATSACRSGGQVSTRSRISFSSALVMIE